jgi:hypothetical protein
VISYRLFRVSFEETKIEIPDACPACSGSFKGPGSTLIEWNWNDLAFYADGETGQPTDARPAQSGGEEFFPFELWCSCGGWNMGCEGEPIAVPTEPIKEEQRGEAEDDAAYDARRNADAEAFANETARIAEAASKGEE